MSQPLGGVAITEASNVDYFRDGILLFAVLVVVAIPLILYYMWQKYECNCNEKTCKCTSYSSGQKKQVSSTLCGLACNGKKTGDAAVKGLTDVLKVVLWLVNHWWVALIGGVLLGLAYALLYKGKWRDVRNFNRWFFEIRTTANEFEKQAADLRESADDLRKQAEEATDEAAKERLRESASKLDAMAGEVDQLKYAAQDIKATEVTTKEVAQYRDTRAAVAEAAQSAAQARQSAGRVVQAYKSGDATQQAAADDEFKQHIAEAQEKIDAARAKFEVK